MPKLMHVLCGTMQGRRLLEEGLFGDDERGNYHVELGY